MVDMKNEPSIVIWEGCDATVSEALEQFRDRWHPYSASSRRYPIVRLIKELIDPAVTNFMARLPARYLGFLPSTRISEVTRLVGFDAMVKIQRQLLRAFIKTTDRQSTTDRHFIATLESLIDLIWSCACKRPLTSKALEGYAPLNAKRKSGFCRFCGNLTEVTAYLERGEWPAQDDENFSLALRLSSRYCSEHRPRHANGTWNPAYRRAKRSLEQFDLDLGRLGRQSTSLGKPKSNSGDLAIDLYIYNHVARQLLQPADKAELRSQARQMVDRKLSDRKKQIVMLLASGFNQSDVARKLGISRQAVSKALASIPGTFRFDAPQEHSAR